MSEEQDKQRMLPAVQDQLSSPESPEVRTHYERLLSLGHTDAEALVDRHSACRLHLAYIAEGRLQLFGLRCRLGDAARDRLGDEEDTDDQGDSVQPS